MDYNMQNAMIKALPKKQQGATLIISMLFLVMLTLIGISSLGSSKLEQRMAHNYQLSSYVFQAAESAIDNSIISATLSYITENATGDVPDPLPKNPTYDKSVDLFLAARQAGLNVTTTTGSYNLDPGTLGAVSITTGSRVVYEGEMPCPPGTSWTSGSFHCGRFKVTGSASIAGTGATATHVVGARYIMPGASSGN